MPLDRLEPRYAARELRKWLRQSGHRWI